MCVKFKIAECVKTHTPPNYSVRYLRYGRLRGSIDFDAQVITCREPKSRKSLVVFLHECGHHACDHRTVDKPLHVREYEAHQWSFDTMRTFGIQIPLEMIQRAKFHTLWCIMRDQDKGVRIDPRIRRFAQDYPWYNVCPRNFDSRSTAATLEATYRQAV